MEKIVRTEIPYPNYLINWRELGKNCPNHYQNNWNKIRQNLVEDLSQLSKANCTFCGGGAPLIGTGEQIEHFKPKHLYPNLSFHWYNLFLCCGSCQKNTRFHGEYKKNKHLLIKPDNEDYEFKKYFRFNTINGEIEPNLRKSKKSQDMAEYTIKYYRLNEYLRPQARKEYFDEYLKRNSKYINAKKFLKYRFLFS